MAGCSADRDRQLSAVLAAKTEEKEDVRHFGEAYRDYVTRTKMFIPWLL
jgi:protein-S-isoprenylcysteine O-methyltransferase Ste14